jgi:hypothetical protein
MPFTCPDCKEKSLSIAASIELGSDANSDETSLQAVRCSGCGLVGVGIYEESRRGASESWHHWAHRMAPEDYDELHKRLSACPKPSSAKCRCAAHRRYQVKSEGGAWRPLEKIRCESDSWFNLH